MIKWFKINKYESLGQKIACALKFIYIFIYLSYLTIIQITRYIYIIYIITLLKIDFEYIEKIVLNY